MLHGVFHAQRAWRFSRVSRYIYGELHPHVGPGPGEDMSRNAKYPR